MSDRFEINTSTLHKICENAREYGSVKTLIIADFMQINLDLHSSSPICSLWIWCYFMCYDTLSNTLISVTLCNNILLRFVLINLKFVKLSHFVIIFFKKSPKEYVKSSCHALQ